MLPGDLARAGALLAAALPGDVEAEVALAPLTTYRVGGPAAFLVRPRSLDALMTVGRVVAECGVPVLVIGRGSNLLVADVGVRAVVVATADLDVGIDGGIAVDTSGDRPVVTAAAGVALPVLARRTAAAGLTGLEWAVGVPGSVGGAVRMNAGGHGSDIAASLIEADVVELTVGVIETRPCASLGLRFRGSDIGPDDVVVSARFALAAGDRTACEAEIAEIVRWRREHQPGGQNAGSVFVNPVPGQVAAAQLIDGLGLRGRRLGTAEVSTKHANFIQADDGGSADDVRALMELVRAAVHDATGVLLRSEVRLIGFPDTMDGPTAAEVDPGDGD